MALALAAFVGSWLAWRKLGPERQQAVTSAAQVELARRAHVVELFNRGRPQLTGTILRGADLTGATNLTVEQLAEAIIDDDTLLPDDIDRLEVIRLSRSSL